MNLKSIWAVIPLIVGLPIALSNPAEAEPQVVTDTSDNGTVTDANGNKNPDELGENDPTPIRYVVNAQIAVAENANPASANTDGTHFTTVVLLVKNVGNVSLSEVQLVNNFTNQFPTGVSFTITDVNTISSTGYVPLTLNPNYDGDANDKILAGTDALKPGQQGAVYFKLTFDPGTHLGPFQNQTTGTGRYVKLLAEDKSDYGTVPDPNNNGNGGDAGENDPTPLSYTGVPRMGLAKTASVATSNGDGSFTTTFTIYVHNVGQQPLSNLRVVDALNASAWTSSQVVVSNLASNDFAVNPNYDGRTVFDLLKQTDTLPVGKSGTITFDATFTPVGQSLTNRATGSATSPNGNAGDTSTSGTNPDPNGDGVPSEQEATSVTWKARPIVGLAKSATEAVAVGNGAYRSTVTFKVENLGDIALTKVQVVDDLRSIFPTGASYTVSNLTSTLLTRNTSFNGNSDKNLLRGDASILHAGKSATISFVLTFVPNGHEGPFMNSAKVRAEEVAQ